MSLKWMVDDCSNLITYLFHDRNSELISPLIRLIDFSIRSEKILLKRSFGVKSRDKEQ